ncbi:hypothetical protein LNN92_06205 [Klebsiella variicola subsp. variicola]|nr:hypothetical protein [Klebsiella variicola subsp. variicola]
MKNHYKNEILSKLKALEECEQMVYTNNFPLDTSTIAAEWVKKKNLKEK